MSNKLCQLLAKQIPSLRRVGWLLACCLACIGASSFRPSEVKVVGDLEYNQISPAIECSKVPRYRALVFNGNGGDQVEVTVRGGQRKAFVAFADGGLKELINGTTHLAYTLPGTGPEIEAYYIVFRDTEDKPATFTVELKKIKKALST